MPSARTFADAGEHRDAFVALDHGMDQLHYEHGLANAGAAEHGCLAALRQRRQQVDDLDAGRKNFRRAALRRKRRRAAMNRTARHIGSEGLALVANGTGEIEQAAEHCLADGHLERATADVCGDATAQSSRRLQGNGANRRLVQMRLHLGNDRGALAGVMSNASSIGGSMATSKAMSSTAPRIAVTRPSIACVSPIPCLATCRGH